MDGSRPHFEVLPLFVESVTASWDSVITMKTYQKFNSFF